MGTDVDQVHVDEKDLSRRFPEATVARLPVYQRIVADMIRSGETLVSSDQLGRRAGVKATKVRRDLSLLGSFGTRGAGYEAKFLDEQMRKALGADRTWPIAIVGMGNLGKALVSSVGFSHHGFSVCYLFDNDQSLVGQTVSTVPIRHSDDMWNTDPIPLVFGVVATPPDGAQIAANGLVRFGATAILNFAPCVLSLPDHIILRYVDLSMELQVLSFYETQKLNQEGAGGGGGLRSIGLTARSEPEDEG